MIDLFAEDRAGVNRRRKRLGKEKREKPISRTVRIAGRSRQHRTIARPRLRRRELRTRRLEALDLRDCMIWMVSLYLSDARRGRGEQRFCAQIVARQLRHDLAAIEDQCAVADLGDLLEVG